MNRLLLMAWGLGTAEPSQPPSQLPRVPPAICRETKKYFQDALDESVTGDPKLAIAAWQGLLMERPVTVSIDKSTMKRPYGDAVRKGLDMWTDALGYSPFVMQDGPADVHVTFVNNVPDSEDLQGQVAAEYRADEVGRTARWSIKANIDVAWKIDGRPLSKNEVTNVIGHELGHVLGLGDLPRLGGVMDYFVPGRPRLRPSHREVQAVRDFHYTIRAAIISTREKMMAGVVASR